MTTKTFKLSIETPEGAILKEVDVNNIKFASDNGALQVFAHHLSFMTSIKYSRIIISYLEDETSQDIFVCRKGIFSFDNKTNSAKLVAEYCQAQSSITPESVKDYLSYIQEQLAKGEDLSQIQLVYLESEKFAVEKMLQD